jgi:ribosomal protein S6
VYELGFHLDPELPTEEVKKAYQAIRESITEKGALVAEGEPQKIPLAYTISRQETSGRRDFDSTYFSWITYEMTPESHTDIISAVGADKRVIRFIDLLTTKDIARHAVEMQELSEKTQKRTPDPEAALDAELDAALESAVA